ncbi:uncharacterized protein BDV14DRAFT_130400 [Aspergillus stella-maris]|uniref:uncharacterized protein n=1 Tax=Aspergillus stella-maris TaxID=1810926 RepID=UPI003CCD47E0
MAPTRQVINAQRVTDFLQYILDVNQSYTILIVCAARESFLEQLLAAVHHESTESGGHHQFLKKTLGMLSSSHNIRTVFCPTLEHLRAYFATGVDGRVPVVEGKEQSKALLAILNPLSLHRSTREFSAQGLSRTLANAVEVSSRTNTNIILCECQDSSDLTNDERGEALWYVEVPLLSNSQRAVAEGSHWPGRAVPIKRVVQRWFHFEDLNKKTI